MGYSLLADEILVKLLKADDETAFREIYSRYWKVLFHTAYHRVGSAETAKELVQNLFLYIWEKRNSLSIANLEHYLQAAMKNRVINHIETLLVHRKYRQHMLNNFNHQSSETEMAVQYNELYLAFEKAIQQLPEKTKTVFRMSRLEQLSVKEIAAHLQVSEKAVEYHITSSLNILRLNLKDFIIGMLAALAICNP